MKKRGRLQKVNMKSLQSKELLVTALPNHGRPVFVPVVIIISVTVKKDST